MILVRKAATLKGKVVNLKDRYIIKCFGPDETKYYLQDVGANILSTDPNKAIFYKNKNGAQSVCGYIQYVCPTCKVPYLKW